MQKKWLRWFMIHCHELLKVVSMKKLQICAKIFMYFSMSWQAFKWTAKFLSIFFIFTSSTFKMKIWLVSASFWSLLLILSSLQMFPRSENHCFSAIRNHCQLASVIVQWRYKYTLENIQTLKWFEAEVERKTQSLKFWRDELEWKLWNNSWSSAYM